MHIQQRTAATEACRTHLVELDDVGVIQHLHDLNFPVDLLQVHGIQLGLVNDLDGHLQERKSTKGRRDLVSRCSANKHNRQTSRQQKNGQSVILVEAKATRPREAFAGVALRPQPKDLGRI